MKHVIVPILSQEDISAIPNVVSFLKALKPETVVVLNNPSLGITPESATAEVDKKLADLEKAKAEAVNREDFPAAHQYKEKIEAAKMERQDALRNGWKSMPETKRFEAYDRMMHPFSELDPTRVDYTVLAEDIDYDTLPVTLANMGRGWPATLPKNKWSLVSPQGVGSLPTPQALQAVPIVGKANTAPKAETPVLEPREARKKHLMKYMAMKKAADQHGIAWQGRKTVDVVEEILEKEGFMVA